MNSDFYYRCLCVLIFLGTGMAVGQTPGSSSPGRGVHSDADQAAPLPTSDEKPLLSQPEKAVAKVGSQRISVTYSSPSRRGRKIMGELVPYGKVWRTGADAATTFVTSGPLTLGATHLPAGSYTLYTLPAAPGSADSWLLILNEQLGQSGLVHDEKRDLVRVSMQAKVLSSPQEAMTISFKKESKSAVTLHIRWEYVDEYVLLDTAP